MSYFWIIPLVVGGDGPTNWIGPGNPAGARALRWPHSDNRFSLGGVVKFTVIPAKAGIQASLTAISHLTATGFWIPAFAGMTKAGAENVIFSI